MKIILALLLLVGVSANGATSVNLPEAFQAAMKRSEDIALQDEWVIQAEEKRVQAQGALFPTLNGIGLVLSQPSPSTSASISPPSQTTLRVNATQPLFRGFREFAALRQQRDLVRSNELNRERAEISLFQDVVLNFYQVLTLEQDLKNYRNEIALNRKRLTDLQNFRRLGKARESDVLLLQSNIAALEAQAEATEGLLDSSRDTFAFLTGLDRASLLRDEEPIPGAPKPLGEYVDRVELRPDIQALVKSASAADEGICIARGAHFPNLDLSGNYYFQRPGFLSDVHWDVQLALTFPLFQGGIIQSQVRSAVSVQHQSELLLSKARRLAKQEIETLFHLYTNDTSQLGMRQKAVDWAMKSYNAEVHDYRLGLVTNLEVLQALNSYQEGQRFLDEAVLRVKSDFLRLQAASALGPTFKERQ